ncbi:MAG TPA: DUF1786 domain-containing protein [Thermomicrobiales bacterium]|nr:DUF1786 domain-containing protein [Thermomicrobiales bacterium]
MVSFPGGSRPQPALYQPQPIQVLAIDVGAGTQDVLLYDSRRTPENCFKLVLPSQTQVVGQRIREVTSAGRPLHLTGVVMGGGASTDAIANHLAGGLSVTATPEAARTLHNDLNRVRAQGVVIQDEALAGAVVVELKDVDLLALARAMALFGVELPEIVAVAVQDHGYRPGSGNNAVRFEHLQRLLDHGGDFSQMVYREPPADMLRMQAVAQSVPGAVLMDTGTAAVLGSLGDPRVAAAVAERGAILVNVGNMHTFATLIKGRRLYGFFEHHTGGITAAIIEDLVARLQAGTLDNETFMRDFDGHGAAVDPAYRDDGPFPFVAVTGPNRAIARPLGYHEAAPHGDMMLTGSFGLVEGALITMQGGARQVRPSLVAH